MKKLTYILSLYFIMHGSIHAQSWSITGNSGTVPPTNFLGTTDNKGLAFRTNNAERMRIAPAGNLGIGLTNPAQKLDVKGNINIGSGFGLFMENRRVFFVDSLKLNTFTGNGIATFNTTGSGNTAAGYYALHSNTTGLNNTANGFDALYTNTSGSYNTANGVTALVQNTTGSYNTASGYQALYFNQDGSYNTATGHQALYFNKASYITANGYRALYSNTTGGFNVANGTFSMYNNTTGYSNAAYGYSSLQANTTGFNNTACGPLSLFSNSTGSYNTATGYRALYSNTADNNTAHGWEALYNNTTGINNVANGESALLFNTTGSYNTGVGMFALADCITGYANTAIGYSADVLSSDYFNCTLLGHRATGTASDQVRIGDFFVTSIGGYANWTNISDGRVKKNIKPNVPGLTFINKLKPVTYNLDLVAADKIIKRPDLKDADGKSIHSSPQEINERSRKENILYSGFVAQDVEKAAKELNYDFSGVDAAKNDRDLYGLRYAEFVVPLVKAVQELSQQNDELKKENQSQQKINSDLQQRVEKLEAMLNAQQGANSNAAKTSLLTNDNQDGTLFQNMPNPFNHTTNIYYTLPQQYNNAKIIVTDKLGKAVKELTVTGNGKGSINIDASTLIAGTYQYSLYVNGRLIDTKQMVLTK